MEQAQSEEEERRLAAAIRAAELRTELAAAESFEQLPTEQSLEGSAAPSEVCSMSDTTVRGTWVETQQADHFRIDTP